MAKRAVNQIIEGLKAAIRHARCDHAPVVQQVHDDGAITEWCPRCETTIYHQAALVLAGKRKH